MQAYANLNGNSGIVQFEIAATSITVVFESGAHYLYDYGSAGRLNVERMKALALEGRGLNSYIMRHAKTLYAKNW